MAIPYLFVYLASFLRVEWRPEIIDQGTAQLQRCLFAASPKSQKSFSTDFPVLMFIHRGISFVSDQDGPTTPNFPTENTSPTAPALDSHLSSHNTQTIGKIPKVSKFPSPTQKALEQSQSSHYPKEQWHLDTAEGVT